jgi:hypothetical protein
MASLKSFLYGLAPILGTTGAALYERQRALVALGVLKPTKGRGPGSGVPFTPYAEAAVLISMLATDNLAEVDERVVGLIEAAPTKMNSMQHRNFVKAGRPTFCTCVAAILAGEKPSWLRNQEVLAISVERCWKGIFDEGLESTQFLTAVRHRVVAKPTDTPRSAIKLRATIDSNLLDQLIVFTKGALSQAVAEEDEE